MRLRWLAVSAVLLSVFLLALWEHARRGEPDRPQTYGAVADSWRFTTSSPLGQQQAPSDVITPPFSGSADDADVEAADAAVASGLSPKHVIYKRWPRPIQSAILSPDEKTIALYDGQGFFLTDTCGKSVRRLRIRVYRNLASEQLTVSFRFRPDSRRVAILTAVLYGEPVGAFIETLWTADTATGRLRRLREWSGRIQGAGPITAERKLEGWSKDGRTVVVSGIIYDGLEMPSDAREAGVERVAVRDTISVWERSPAAPTRMKQLSTSSSSP